MTRINALLLLAGTALAADVEVGGALLEVNGTSEIPAGMFGVHGLPLSEAMVADWGVTAERTINHNPNGTPGRSARAGVLIECFWDRYQPALVVTRADWREHLEQLGRTYGEQAKGSGRRHHIEFWNEAYLNWATRPGVNYHGVHFDQSNAAPGAPMRLKTTGEEVPGLVWDRQSFVALLKANRTLDYFGTSRIPGDGKPGETVKLMGAPGSIELAEGAEVAIFGKRILRQDWFGRDTTQKHYWSGEVNRRFYLDMYQAFARSLKAANPEVQVAAGWGFNMFNEDWDAWHLLYRPTIDAVHDCVDAIHEHHYGGDTRLVAASYEVAYAYARSRYGRELRFWNTESGGQLDPEQGGVRWGADEDPLRRAVGSMTYHLRDVIHLLALCPDKAYARAAHHPHESGGDETAFRLLKPLRGRLLQTASADPAVWTVASLDGDRLCLVLFNDLGQERRLGVRIAAPSGSFAGGERLEARVEEQRLAIVRTPLPQATGAVWTGELTMPPRTATTLVLSLAGAGQPAATVRWRQHVADAVLQPVAAGGSCTASIAIPADGLAGAARARLRLVLDRHPAGLAATLNGTTVPLRSGTPWIVDHEVDPGILRADNRLELRSIDGTAFTLCTASLWLGR